MSPDLPPIPEEASLSQWQSYLAKVVQARGWDKASELELFLLLNEEIGEFAKALRKSRDLFNQEGVAAGAEQSRQELADELADIFSYVLDLANRLEIDLETAFRDKERKNRERSWG